VASSASSPQDIKKIKNKKIKLNKIQREKLTGGILRKHFLSTLLGGA